MSRKTVGTRKRDLSQATFVIPLRIDTEERLRNVRLVIDYLGRNLETNFVIIEYDQTRKFNLGPSPDNLRHIFIETDDVNFWKTKAINLAARYVHTPYLVIQDADVIIEPHHLSEAHAVLCQDGADIVFPFKNDVMWVPSEVVDSLDRIDPGEMTGWQYETASKRGNEYLFVGLCVFISLASFLGIGKFNQNIRSWGYEDVEFYERAKKFGLRIRRLKNLPYHLGHTLSEDSRPHNRYFQHNRKQYERTRRSSKEELAGIVGKWKW